MSDGVNFTKYFSILYLFLLITLLGCSSSQVRISGTDKFFAANKKFSEFFPNKFPPKKLKLPLKTQSKAIITDMSKAFSEYLSFKGIKNQLNVSKHEVTILPKGDHYLNKVAKTLASSGIKLKYNGLYFAENPFSVGTFNENRKEMLISHRTFEPKIDLNTILEHELIHVGTYLKKQKKLPSLFYCKFKGEQFSPYYLSCDEMNAYHNDLKSLLKKKSNNIVLQSKIKAALMHTEPIPPLIDTLILSSFKVKEGIITIKGKNTKGKYTIEFPSYSIKSQNRSIKKKISLYLSKLREKSQEILNFIYKTDK